MNGGGPPLWAACVLGIASIALLRYAWSFPRRSIMWNGAAWAALATSVMCAWWQAGAWGVAIAGLVVTSAAFVALVVAGARSPHGRATPSKQRVGMLAEPGEPKQVRRRIGTFLFVIPGGFVISIMLSFAMRSLGEMLGWGEANANVIALFTVPIAWAVFSVVVLMQVHRHRQIATMLVCALFSTPALLTGLGS